MTAGTQATTTVSLDDNDVALTASVSGEPATHDGQTAFSFELRFSEHVAVGYLTLEDDAFEVTGGEVTSASRLVQGSNQGWTITIDPDGDGDVTVVLPVTTDCAAEGAICTADGRPLTERVEFTVAGPTPPPAPTNLTAGTVTATSVPLSWDAVSGATTYRVEYRLGDPDGWTLDDDSVTGTSHTVDELRCGTSYEFRVSAYGDGVSYTATWGTAYAEHTATTSACPPPAPTNLTATVNTDGHIVLSWDRARRRLGHRLPDPEAAADRGGGHAAGVRRQTPRARPRPTPTRT